MRKTVIKRKHSARPRPTSAASRRKGLMQRKSKCHRPPGLRPLPKGAKPRLAKGSKKRCRYGSNLKALKGYQFISLFMSKMGELFKIRRINGVSIKISFTRIHHCVCVSVKLRCRFRYNTIKEIVGFYVHYGKGMPVRKEVLIERSGAEPELESWMKPLHTFFVSEFEALIAAHKEEPLAINNSQLKAAFENPAMFFFGQSI